MAKDSGEEKISKKKNEENNKNKKKQFFKNIRMPDSDTNKLGFRGNPRKPSFWVSKRKPNAGAPFLKIKIKIPTNLD